MKYFFRLLVILLIPFTIFSCGSEPGCGYVDTAYTTYFPCYVADKITKKSLISNFGSPYDNSFSSLLNEQGEDVLIDGPILNDGTLYIPPAIEGKDSIGISIMKTYYLHLVDGNKIEKDIDTIRFKYELYKADNCHRIDFKNFKCYFNDSLYVTEFPWDLPPTLFYK